MAMKRNKFEGVVEQMNQEEAAELERNKKVISKIAGIKRGRPASNSKRKVLPTYIPEDLYNEFLAITNEYGISQNAGICQAIREYVKNSKDRLGLE